MLLGKRRAVQSCLSVGRELLAAAAPAATVAGAGALPGRVDFLEREFDS
jgi:hypothetical protein